MSAPFIQVVPLGVNGFYAAQGRQTMTFLVEAKTSDGHIGLLLDAGTGVGRLAESNCPVALQEFVRLEVVLTHYHLDHVAGLAALPAAFRSGGGTAPIRLWAPGRPLVDADPMEDLHRLIAPPLFPYRLDAFDPPLDIRSYGSATDLDALGTSLGVEIRVQRNRHPGGAVGLRLGDQLAYVTDSAPDSMPSEGSGRATRAGGTIDLVRNVDTLIHEVWATAAEATDQPQLLQGHCDTQAVRKLAKAADVQRLVPVHHPPQRDDAAIDELHDELQGASYELHRPHEGQAIVFREAQRESEAST